MLAKKLVYLHFNIYVYILYIYKFLKMLNVQIHKSMLSVYCSFASRFRHASSINFHDQKHRTIGKGGRGLWPDPIPAPILGSAVLSLIHSTLNNLLFTQANIIIVTPPTTSPPLNSAPLTQMKRLSAA